MIAIIPAKGYSSRLPNKNSRPLCGVPLVAWSIIQAKQARQIDEVYVSTNDDNIARITEQYSGKVIWRDYKEDVDDSGGVPIYQALEKLALDNQAFVNILCTSPLRYPGMMESMIDLWYSNEEIEVVTALGRDRECQVSKDIGGGKFESVLCVKDYSILYGSNSMCVSTTDGYKKQFEWCRDNIGVLDSTIDAVQNSGEAPKTPKTAIVSVYYPVHVWQTFETDTEYDFRICEVLMENLILKGRPWRDVYGRERKETDLF